MFTLDRYKIRTVTDEGGIPILYADKYIPNEVQIKVKEYEITSAVISLKKDKLILGSINVKHMELQGIIDVGIDLSDPANINTFEFRLTITLKQIPIPVEILCNGGAGKGADFEGTRMPFNKKVMAHFESSNKFEVNGSTGMHIIIMTDKSAYIRAPVEEIKKTLLNGADYL